MSETNEENIAYINFTDEVTVNPYIILFFYLYPVLVGVGLRGFGLRLWGGLKGPKLINSMGMGNIQQCLGNDDLFL